MYIMHLFMYYTYIHIFYAYISMNIIHLFVYVATYGFPVLEKNELLLRVK